jgi:hypothetical protein
MSRVRTGLLALVLALIVSSGAQAAYACNDPAIGKLAATAKAGQKVPYKLTSMTAGAEYLVRVSGREVSSGTAAGTTLSERFKMPDLGDKSRTAKVEVVVAHDACENSPWKLKAAMGYVVPAAPAPTTNNQTSPTPAVPVVANPAPRSTSTGTPSSAKVSNPAKAIKAAPSSKPAQPAEPSAPALNGRAWVTPTDPAARSTAKLAQPELPRSRRPVEQARSAHALIGLGVIFILIAIGTGVGLLALNRKDAEINTDEEEGRLPSHLGEEAPKTGEHAAGDLVATPVVAAAAVTGAASGAASGQEVVNGNGHSNGNSNGHANGDGHASGSPPAQANGHATGQANGHTNGNGNEANGQATGPENGAQVEAELQTVLGDAGVQGELDGILAAVTAEAERKGVAVDPDAILAALCSESEAVAGLSEPARDELRSQFRQIIAEERQRVPQAHA